MKTTLFTAASLAVSALAATVTFASLDGISRTIYSQHNPTSEDIDPIRVPAGALVKVSFPDSWQGMFYSVSDGAPDVVGVLGEVTFGGWQGLTYFDVSAIDNPNDHAGVHEIWPLSEGRSKLAGCNPFSCPLAYYHPNDDCTKTTEDTDLICTLFVGSHSNGDAEWNSLAQQALSQL